MIKQWVTTRAAHDKIKHKTMTNTFYTVDPELKPYDFMPWDTRNSFEIFTKFYLVLPSDIRSYPEAYRQWHISTRGREPARPYSGQWSRYIQGIRGNGRNYTKMFRYEVGPGDRRYNKLYRIPTWRKRAEAFDVYIALKVQEEAREKFEKQKAESLDSLTRAYFKVGEHLIKELQNYVLTGDLDLDQASRIMLRMSQVFSNVWGEGNAPTVDGKAVDGSSVDGEPVSGEAEEGGDMLSVLQSILNRAKER